MSKQTTLITQLRKTIEAKQNYPIGVLAYYGPDDQTITKVVAIAMPTIDSIPMLQRWYGPGVTTDPQAAVEIGQFFQKHQVTEVVMTEGVIGCPHEEGVDYHLDEQCPKCPFWAEM
jgi:hypothetical protein